jgi:hypothetical protein
MVVSSRLATLRELQTDYGILDLYNLAELVSVDAVNHVQIANAKNQS